jgi:hypothetical protein
MDIKSFHFLVDGYVSRLRDLDSPCTKAMVHQMCSNVVRQFRAAAKSVDKLPQPSREHENAVVNLARLLSSFDEASEQRQLLNAKMNPDSIDDSEKKRIEETDSKLVGSVRKRRKMISKGLEYDPESKSRAKVVKEWLSVSVIDSIPSTPPYPAFFFKKLNKPCIVRKIPASPDYGTKSAIYICIFDNGDVAYLSDTVNTEGKKVSAEDNVRVNLRELRFRGHTRKTYTVAEIEEGLLKRGFDPAQVHEIAIGHSIVEEKQFSTSTGSKVFVKSIPPGKDYDNKLGIVLSMRLSMTEQPVDVTSFVGEVTGKSHNVRIFKVFLEDETIRYVWGEEVHHQIEEGTHEAVVLDALYERLVERKKEESDARMQEFISMIHEYDEDEESAIGPELEIPSAGKDDFKHRVRRLVKDD